jgi:hypothetical protein
MEGADVVDFFDVAFLVGAHGWSYNMGEAADAVGDDLDRIAKKSTEVAGVTLTDAAETNDEDFHGRLLRLLVRDRGYGQKFLTKASWLRIQLTSSPSSPRATCRVRPRL